MCAGTALRPVSPTNGGTMQQERLFPSACAAIALTAVYDVPSGWRLMINHRLEGDVFDDADRSDYSHCTSAELFEVILCELSRRLGDV